MSSRNLPAFMVQYALQLFNLCRHAFPIHLPISRGQNHPFQSFAKSKNYFPKGTLEISVFCLVSDAKDMKTDREMRKTKYLTNFQGLQIFT